MKAHPNPGASMLGGIARNRSGMAPWIGANDGWPGAFGQVFVEFAQATMAAYSRYANDTLSQQLRHVYAAAERARDCARAVAIAVREYPEGAARDALLAALGRQEAGAGQMMDAVLRHGREHGHLAFAFPVHPVARPRSTVAAHRRRNMPARRNTAGRDRWSG